MVNGDILMVNEDILMVERGHFDGDIHRKNQKGASTDRAPLQK